MNNVNSTFSQYSKIYDLINGSKDYKTEAEKIISLIAQYSKNKKSYPDMLEIGSGTGGHAKYFREHFELICLEKSSEMAEICAKKTGLHVVQGEAQSFEIHKRFDAMTAMFHVINYLPNLNELDRFFYNSSRHLNQNGVLVFDMWHLPSVYSIGTSSRKVSVENDEFDIIRVSIPEHDCINNIVKVLFNFTVSKKDTDETFEFSETHYMRPWTISEIKFFAEKNGLSIINDIENSPSAQDPSYSWDLTLVLGHSK